MTGDEHYREAERLAEVARTVIKDADDLRTLNDSREALVEWDSGQAAARTLISLADVHATLALAAATEKQNRLSHGSDDGGYGR